MGGGMKPTVLVVEDDADIREAVSVLLKDEGVTVAAAAHGLEGLQLLGHIDTPRLILLDWRMPIVSGREFLEGLRSSPKMCTIPVVVMTADDEASPPGVSAILRKPFRVTQLLELLTRHGARQPVVHLRAVA